MSKTLNLADCLLTTARNLAHVGRNQSARDLLTRLVRFRDLPATIAEPAHLLLADLHHKNENYRKARRHLTVALGYDGNKAASYFQMAGFIEADPDVQPERARPYYRRALKLDPKNAAYWADYGIYLMSLGERRTGAKALCRAARLAEHDADLLGRIATSLRQEGLYELARRLLWTALFRNRGDRRFTALWQQHRFQMLCEKQRRSRRTQETIVVRPTLLPFVLTEPRGTYQNLGGKTIRIDRAAPLSEPKTPQRQPFQRPL